MLTIFLIFCLATSGATAVNVTRRECTAMETERRDCFKGALCFVIVVQLDMEREDHILCQCDHVFTGERCDEPSGDHHHFYDAKAAPIVGCPRCEDPRCGDLPATAFLSVTVLALILLLILVVLKLSLLPRKIRATPPEESPYVALPLTDV